MIKLVDQLSPMGSFPVAEAKDINFSDNESLQDKYDNGELSGSNADYSFETLDLLKEYVATSTSAYPGQLLYDKSTGILYKVNKDKTGVDTLAESELALDGYTEEEILEKLGLTQDKYEEFVAILTNAENADGVPILQTDKTWHSSGIFQMLEKYSEELKKYTDEELALMREAHAEIVDAKPDANDPTIEQYTWYFYKVDEVWMQTLYIGDKEVTLQSGASNLDFEYYTKQEILSKVGITEEEVSTFKDLLTDEATVSDEKTWNSTTIKKYVDDKINELKTQLGLS